MMIYSLLSGGYPERPCENNEKAKDKQGDKKDKEDSNDRDPFKRRKGKDQKEDPDPLSKKKDPVKFIPVEEDESTPGDDDDRSQEDSLDPESEQSDTSGETFVKRKDQPHTSKFNPFNLIFPSIPEVRWPVHPLDEGDDDKFFGADYQQSITEVGEDATLKEKKGYYISNKNGDIIRGPFTKSEIEHEFRTTSGTGFYALQIDEEGNKSLIYYFKTPQGYLQSSAAKPLGAEIDTPGTESVTSGHAEETVYEIPTEPQSQPSVIDEPVIDFGHYEFGSDGYVYFIQNSNIDQVGIWTIKNGQQVWWSYSDYTYEEIMEAINPSPSPEQSYEEPDEPTSSEPDDSSDSGSDSYEAWDDDPIDFGGYGYDDGWDAGDIGGWNR